MLRELIQRTLIQHAQTGVFYRATYDSNSQLPNLITEGSEKIKPTSVRTNETDERFSIDPRNGMNITLKQDEWTFTLLLSFQCEVSLEAYKLDLMQNPFFLRPNDNDHWPPTTVVLSRISAKHPIQQQSTSGTEAVVVFRAMLGRVV